MRALLKPNFFVLDPNSPANTDHTNYETQIREVDPIGSVFKLHFRKKHLLDFTKADLRGRLCFFKKLSRQQ